MMYEQIILLIGILVITCLAFKLPHAITSISTLYQQQNQLNDDITAIRHEFETLCTRTGQLSTDMNRLQQNMDNNKTWVDCQSKVIDMNTTKPVRFVVVYQLGEQYDGMIPIIGCEEAYKWDNMGLVTVDLSTNYTLTSDTGPLICTGVTLTCTACIIATDSPILEIELEVSGFQECPNDNSQIPGVLQQTIRYAKLMGVSVTPTHSVDQEGKVSQKTTLIPVQRPNKDILSYNTDDSSHILSVITTLQKLTFYSLSDTLQTCQVDGDAFEVVSIRKFS